MSAKPVDHARTASNEEDIRRIAATVGETMAKTQVISVQPAFPPITKFVGNNVTKFLNRFEKEMATMGVGDDSKVDWLEEYVVEKEATNVKILTEDRPWKTAKEALIKYYSALDSAQKDTLDERLRNHNAKRPETYEQVSDWIQTHDYLCRKKYGDKYQDTTTESGNIYNALPRQIRVGVLAKSGLNIGKLTALKYGTFTEKVLTFLEPYLEDSRRQIAAEAYDQKLRQGHEEAVKFFPEEKRPTSPERIHEKSFNKANKKTTAPDPVLTKVDDLTKQLSSLSINMANIQDELYSLTNRERNRYALGFHGRPIVTAGVQGQDVEASSDAEDRDIAINMISGTHDKELGFGRYDPGTGEIFLGSAALFSQVPPSLGNKFIGAGTMAVPAYNWAATEKEQKIIQSFTDRNEMTRWTLPPATDASSPMTSVIMIQRDEPRVDQMVHINSTQIAVNAHELKRPRVEEVLDDEVVPQTPTDGPSQTQSSTMRPSNGLLPAQAKEAAQRNTDINRQKGAQKEALLAATNLRRRLNPEFRKDKVTNMLADEMVSKKIPISIADLIHLVPEFGHLAAQQFMNKADGVDHEAFTDKVVTIEKRPTSTGTHCLQIEPEPEVLVDGDPLDFIQEIHHGLHINVLQLDTVPLQPLDQYPTVQDERICGATDHVSREIFVDRVPDALVVGWPSRVPDSPWVMPAAISPFDTPKMMQDLPRMQVRVGSLKSPIMLALLDTGAETNILTASAARDLNLECRPIQVNTMSFNKKQTKLMAIADTVVFVGPVCVPIRIFICDDDVLVPFILGMPFIRLTKLSFDHRTTTGNLHARCLFGSTRVVTPVAGPPQWDNEHPILLPLTSVVTLSDAAPTIPKEGGGEMVVAQKGFDQMSLDPEDEVAALRISYETLLDVLDMLVNEGDLTTSSEAMAMLKVAQDVERQDNLARWQATPIVGTMYKRKADKKRPVDNVQPDGSIPIGTFSWKMQKWDQVKDRVRTDGPFDQYITGKFSAIPEGERLTFDRLEEIRLRTTETLSDAEWGLLRAILFNREAALSWDHSERGQVDPLVAPPVVFKVIEHKAWQAKPVNIPKAMLPQVVELLKNRVQYGVLEPSHASYRNHYMVVAKKDGGVRLINSVTMLNSYTIRDANPPPCADEFSEQFATCKILTLLDLFSGYDQMPLDPRSRDYTTFATPIGLFRQCTVPMGATNSVGQFMRVMQQILFDLIPEVCNVFVDDIPVRGPETTYDNEEALPGIRRYIFEHLLSLDKVLVNIELAGCTVAGKKSQWCQTSTELVGYMVGTHGRKPVDYKVEKLKSWVKCDSVRQVRCFLGLVGFYRIWIPKFAWIAKPLTSLLKKDAAFEWTDEHSQAMADLKAPLLDPQFLVPLDLGPNHGEIILMCDASATGWGAVLFQEIDNVRRTVRFESGIWNPAEANYVATKRECKAVLCAMRRLRLHLYGVHFILETDARVLVDQLKGSLKDVPGAMVTRWVSYIFLFDFTVRHISGEKNLVADALSRKPTTEIDRIEREKDGDSEDFVDLHLNSIQSSLPDQMLSDTHRRIADFLREMKRPQPMKPQVFRRFKNRAMTFMIADNQLWKRPTHEERFPRLVVDNEDRRRAIVTKFHEQMGHKGRQVTYTYVKERYWWPGLWNYVMAPAKDLTMVAMTKFVLSIIYRFGVPIQAVIDGGPEVKSTFRTVLEDFGVQVVLISRYNPKANAVVEVGHQSITGALAKFAKETGKWVKFLPQAILADRTAIKNSHGRSAFYLLFGWDPVLPLEVEFPTWRLIQWNEVKEPLDLLAARMRVLGRKKEDVDKARLKVAAYRVRLAKRTDNDNRHTIRDQPIQPGDLVLSYDVRRATDHGRISKLKMRWDGPFRVISRAEVTGSYRIETLDGIPLDRTISGDHLKAFRQDADGWWESSSDDWLLQNRSSQSLPLPDENNHDSTDSLLASSQHDDELDQMVLRSHDVPHEVPTDDSVIADGLRPTSAKPRSTIEVRLPQISDAQKSLYIGAVLRLPFRD
ncbi:hypothetical protein L249_0751 [Ophiocordyceps polyrhachis-furcata BCC 54312]|uniref:RNA-directed DNA polymerase n=1 Tax=Ophiocordyceps polyrhachis-furcata BCC 54312 TaxID=1330021 RepID=A0A367LCG5_9HYPO|nr:hypothetical protein L249_0751 [Ophiocordyceps polyrhachis-furcata BCC 54312]